MTNMAEQQQGADFALSNYDSYPQEIPTEQVSDYTTNATENVTENEEPMEEVNESITENVNNNEILNGSSSDKESLMLVLQFLKKYNLKETEELLKKEAKQKQDALGSSSLLDQEASNVFAAYQSEGDPDTYDEAYSSYRKFVENSLDMYKHELSMISYPLFVHMYLEMIYNGHSQQAIRFINKYGPAQEDYYLDDVQKLSYVTKKEHMSGNDLIDSFKSSQFTVRMSRDTYSVLKRFIQDKKNQLVMNIIQEHLYLDMYEGVPRGKAQIDSTAGAMEGEAVRQINKTKVFYGLLKEPEIQFTMVEEEEEEANPDGVEKPKKKKPKKDPLLSKKAKNDPNAPPATRIPLPDLRDIDKLEKIKALREASKRVNLGSETLPSICFYTMLNSPETVTCIEVTEDSSIMAAGFSDSRVKVWSLVPQKLRGMKPADQLADIDKEAEDVLVRMMDDRNAESTRLLLGHTGPVYALSFSPDRATLLSSSEDASIRLWSLQTWTCLVVYRGHGYPVWDVEFSPHGYYFASAGHDRTARLWATDHHQPLRLLAGHYADVDCVRFHPNSNYIATGSSDRSVRLWDVTTGTCARLLTGHKGTVYALCFSTDGRFLASGAADKRVLIWDMAHGHLLAELTGHQDTVYSLCFSREGTILATGSLDCSILLWNFQQLTEESSLEDVNISHNPDVKRNVDAFRLGRYPTKATPVLALHFTRRNLLLAAGMFES